MGPGEPGGAADARESGPLRRLRIAAGLSQQELARRAGISVRALRYLENGGVGRPQAASIHRLAGALGVPAEDMDRLFTTGSALRPSAGDRAAGPGPGGDGGVGAEAGDAAPDPASAGAARGDGARAPRLRVEALGPLVVRRDGREVPIGSAMRRTLLGLLAVQPGRSVGIDEVIETLWPESAPPTCRELVHTYVSGVRRLLEPGSGAAAPARTPPRGGAGKGRGARVIRSTADGYRLDLDADGLDVVQFERLTTQGHAAVRARAVDSAAQLFAEAWALWRGPLPTGDPRTAQHPAVVRLVQRRVEAVLAWADAAFVRAGYGEVAPALRTLLDEDPLHESLAARLMLALAGDGRQAAALELFERTRARLNDELGIRPGPELSTAHLRVLRGQLPPVERRAAPGAAPPAQLPPEPSPFVGRAEQLAALDALIGADGPVARVALVTGMPGAGKTALAVHWAHALRDRFPDGQLYVDLRGHSRELPVQALHALAGFLHGLGVPPEQVPGDAQQAAAAYRSRLAGKRVLILLDNAASAEQVRPLLPGGPGSLALVTSRYRLGGLVARDGARPVPLAPLGEAESYQLLERLVGAERTLAEPAAVAETAQLCAQLPLALRIAAANLTTRPQQRIAHFNERLRGGNRLDALETSDDADTAVRAAFALSCDELPAAERRMFRLLALAPGADVSTGTAAALAAVGPDAADRSLRRLADRHLVVERSLDRYTLHDLLRLHARELPWPSDPAAPGHRDERAPYDGTCACRDFGEHAAFIRLARHQRSRLAAVAGLLYPHLLHLPADHGQSSEDQGSAVGDPVGESTAAPSDPDWDAADARAWLDDERANLAALVRHLNALGHHADAWRIADLLAGAHMLRGSSAEWRDVCEAAHAAAQADGDWTARAAMELHLATALQFDGQLRRAAQGLRAAAESARKGGWTQGEAVALNNLAICLWTAGEPEQAVTAFERALVLHRRAGRTAGEAVTLSNLGVAYADQGKEPVLGDRERAALQTAIAYLRDGLALHRKIADRRNEGETLRALGEAHRDAGELDTALDYADRALRLARETEDRRFEARALSLLGTVHARLGRRADAAACRAEALEAAARIGEPRAEAEANLAAAETSLTLDGIDEALLYLDNARVLARRIGSGMLERQCDRLMRRIPSREAAA